MARWKAWLCRFGMRRHENVVALVAGLCRNIGLDTGNATICQASAAHPPANHPAAVPSAHEVSSWSNPFLLDAEVTKFHLSLFIMYIHYSP